MRLIDGTTVTLADAEENQAAYPQLKSQKAGLGSPLGRVVALTCLTTGALLNAAMGPCKDEGSDEQDLLRGLLETLRTGETLVADAYYARYCLLCELIRRGLDGLFER